MTHLYRKKVEDPRALAVEVTGDEPDTGVLFEEDIGFLQHRRISWSQRSTIYLT